MRVEELGTEGSGWGRNQWDLKWQEMRWKGRTVSQRQKRWRNVGEDLRSTWKIKKTKKRTDFSEERVGQIQERFRRKF